MDKYFVGVHLSLLILHAMNIGAYSAVSTNMLYIIFISHESGLIAMRSHGNNLATKTQRHTKDLLKIS